METELFFPRKTVLQPWIAVENSAMKRMPVHEDTPICPDCVGERFSDDVKAATLSIAVEEVFEA